MTILGKLDRVSSECYLWWSFIRKAGSRKQRSRMLWPHCEVGPDVQKRYQCPEPRRHHQLPEKAGREVGNMHKRLVFILLMPLPKTLKQPAPNEQTKKDIPCSWAKTCRLHYTLKLTLKTKLLIFEVPFPSRPT